jgi:hypothetical protein
VPRVIRSIRKVLSPYSHLHTHKPRRPSSILFTVLSYSPGFSLLAIYCSRKQVLRSTNASSNNISEALYITDSRHHLSASILRRIVDFNISQSLLSLYFVSESTQPCQRKSQAMKCRVSVEIASLCCKTGI